MVSITRKIIFFILMCHVVRLFSNDMCSVTKQRWRLCSFQARSFFYFTFNCIETHVQNIVSCETSFNSLILLYCLSYYDWQNNEIRIYLLGHVGSNAPTGPRFSTVAEILKTAGDTRNQHKNMIYL